MKNFKIDSPEKQIKFCNQMSCLACNLFTDKDYKKCPHLENKLKARDNQKRK